ncbi:hypothetical protein ACWIGW_44220 [Nocardia brasiliensis]|uniref:hypothetical protein n=1 Tax=Streptomyces sp. NPDC056056 TaxID=3345698 RepID=UPI0035DC67DF
MRLFKSRFPRMNRRSKCAYVDVSGVFLPSDLVMDDRISLRALAVGAVVANYPENWVVTADDVLRGRESETDISAELAELTAAGYLRCTPARDGRSRPVMRLIAISDPQRD